MHLMGPVLAAVPAQLLSLPLVVDGLLLLILLLIGIIIIVAIAKILWAFLPAVIVAIVVWFLTGSLFFAGLAFLIIALISLIRR